MKASHILVLAAVFGTMIACKKGPVVVTKDPGPAQALPGGAIAQSADGEVSIMIYPGWKRGGPYSGNMPSLSDLGALGGGSTDVNSDLTNPSQPVAPSTQVDVETEADLAKKGIAIWVNDSSRPIPGEERTSYRIKVNTDGPKSLEDAAADVKQDLLNEGPVQYVELPIGKAARYEAKTTKIDGGELYQIVYVLVNGDKWYTVKFTTQNAPSTVQNVEKAVIDSLRIKPAKA